jgi:hypothetical protein
VFIEPPFLIDEKGKIKKIFEKVKPEDHASEVLEAFADRSTGMKDGLSVFIRVHLWLNKRRNPRRRVPPQQEARLPPSLQFSRVPLQDFFQASVRANN